MFDVKQTESLLNIESNQRLRSVYDRFGVGNLEVSSLISFYICFVSSS